MCREFARRDSFAVLVVHLKSGRDGLTRRREQWAKLRAVVTRHREETRLPIALVGDLNSSGFLDNEGGERDDLRRTLAAAGLHVVTANLGCSEYYEREPDSGSLEVALLDHVAVSEDFPLRGGMAARAEVTGYCAEVACRAELREKPRDFEVVSDHCPVVAGTR